MERYWLDSSASKLSTGVAPIIFPQADLKPAGTPEFFGEIMIEDKKLLRRLVFKSFRMGVPDTFNPYNSLFI